jgi:hypothetical protein
MKHPYPIVALILILLPGCCGGPRYILNENEVAMEYPNLAPDTTGSFTANICRDEPDDEMSARLLDIAESLYLPKSILFEVVKDDDLWRDPDPENEYLWYRYPNRYLPYSLTKGAAIHYINELNEYRRGEFDNSGTDPYEMAHLRYYSSIRFRLIYERDGKIYRRVYVADSEMEWNSRTQYNSGTWFTKQRTVIFNSDGNVLSVLGDGPAKALTFN